VKLVSTKSNWIKQHTVACWVIFFLLAVVGISVLHPNFYYYRILSVVVDNYNAYINISAPDDVILFSSLEPTILSMAKNTPWAVVSGFFRPFVWESSTLFQAASGLESLVLLGLLVVAIFRFKNWSTRFNALHLALLFYLIILAALLALSTPNFGSLSRYRIGFTPFLWLILLLTSGIIQYLPNRMQRLLDSAL
jgi:hypothetical protein